MKKILMLGAGGYIVGHLVKRLKKEDYCVRSVNIKFHEYVESPSDVFVKSYLW